MSTDSTNSKPPEINVAVIGTYFGETAVHCYSDVRTVAEATAKFKSHIVAAYGYHEEDAGAKLSVCVTHVLVSSSPIHRHS